MGLLGQKASVGVVLTGFAELPSGKFVQNYIFTVNIGCLFSLISLIKFVSFFTNLMVRNDTSVFFFKYVFHKL